MRPALCRPADPEGHRHTTVELAFSILLVITSALLILLVLMHKGKGGGLSDMFGGGVSSSVGGSSVAERNLDRLTIALGLVWAAAIVALGLLNAS
nr:preprotein translocase subunit SecG [Jiangella ureilytica]